MEKLQRHKFLYNTLKLQRHKFLSLSIEMVREQGRQLLKNFYSVVFVLIQKPWTHVLKEDSPSAKKVISIHGVATFSVCETLYVNCV